MDGAVYEWDPYSGKRTGDCVLKSCSYYGVATSPDGKNTFAVGSDKTLKEITLAEANVSVLELDDSFNHSDIRMKFIKLLKIFWFEMNISWIL